MYQGLTHSRLQGCSQSLQRGMANGQVKVTAHVAQRAAFCSTFLACGAATGTDTGDVGAAGGRVINTVWAAASLACVNCLLAEGICVEGVGTTEGNAKRPTIVLPVWPVWIYSCPAGL